MLDVVAFQLTRCVETDRTFWGWSTQEWVAMLRHDQAEFRRNAPAWVGDEVRPYLAAHAHLVGSFTEFHRLGSIQRLDVVRAGLRARPGQRRDRAEPRAAGEVGLSARPR